MNSYKPIFSVNSCIENENMLYYLYIVLRGVKMKKFISVLLSTVIIVSSLAVGFTAFAADDTTKFFVASDLHYNIPSEELVPIIEGDEIYWYANRRAAMEEESSLIIDEFLNQCAESDDCEFVLLSGDLVDNGKAIHQEHIDMAAKLEKFEQESGKPVYVIPGNHDYGVDCETNLDDFVRVYNHFGYDEALTTLEGTGSYTADLNDDYRLIALDSCDPTKSTEDGMSAEKLEWVKEQAAKAKEDGKYPILMMHHNLLDHLPLQRILSRNFIVRFHYTTATLFADWGIKLVFTGHEHCSDAATYTSPSGNVIYDFATTSLTMYPLQYRAMALTDDEIKYEARTIDSIDTDALTSTISGYTQEQIDLMNAGLNDYAKGFLKAGVQYRLGKGFRMEEMGIEEDAFYYDLVATAVGGLVKILEEPLYGEGGIQELAAEYNIDIPDSEYKNGWDIVTELVSWHYSGSEPYDLYSRDIAIFLRLVALLLKDDLATVSDEVFFKAANQLFSYLGTDSIVRDITKLGTSVFGGVTAAEYFLLALVSPLISAFIADDDGVDDNNGVIPGYGTVDAQTRAANVFDNFVNILKSFFETFMNVITILLKIA